MYYRTRQWTYKTAILDGMLAALGTRPAAALLTTPSIVLYTVGPVPTPAMDLANYTMATFRGYAADLITLTGPVILGGNDMGMIGTVNFAVTAGSPLTDTLLGYLLTDGVTALYGGEAFPAPITVSGVGSFLQIDVVIPLPQVFTPTIS